MVSSDASAPVFSISRKALSRLFNEVTKGPIGASADVDFPSSTFSEQIPLTTPSKIECKRDVGACRHRDICNKRSYCVGRIKNTFPRVEVKVSNKQGACTKAKDVCKKSEWFLPTPSVKDPSPDKILKCVQSVSECVTYETIKVTENITTMVEDNELAAACDRVGKIAKEIPGVCEAADEADQLPCNALKELEVGQCQVNRETLNKLAANPLAKISGKYSGSIRGKLSLNGNVSVEFERLSLRLAYDATATIAAVINFEPESIRAFDASCQLNTKANISGKGMAKGLVEAAAPIVAEQSVNDLILRMKFDKITVPVDLNKSPFAMVFGDNPVLLLQCHLLGAAAAAFGTWDTVVTQKLSRVSPFIDGKNIPVALKNLQLDVRIKPMKFLGTDLPAKWQSRALIFGGS